MLRIRLIGDWSAGQVDCRWTASTFRSPPEVLRLIEQAWRNAARRGVQLFDGPMCRLEEVRSEGDRLHILLSRTSYRLFLGTNLHNAELADRHGPSVLANPVGLSCALVSADGRLMLGQRNDRVAYYPSRIHPFAGAMEGIDGPDVFAEVRRELAEELSLADDQVSAVRCISLVEDAALRQPEFIFLTQCSLSCDVIAQKLDATEHRSTVALAQNAGGVAHFLQDKRLTPVAVGMILLWGRTVFGDAWFSAALSVLGLPPTT